VLQHYDLVHNFKNGELEFFVKGLSFFIAGKEDPNTVKALLLCLARLHGRAAQLAGGGLAAACHQLGLARQSTIAGEVTHHLLILTSLCQHTLPTLPAYDLLDGTTGQHGIRGGLLEGHQQWGQGAALQGGVPGTASLLCNPHVSCGGTPACSKVPAVHALQQQAGLCQSCFGVAGGVPAAVAVYS